MEGASLRKAAVKGDEDGIKRLLAAFQNIIDSGGVLRKVDAFISAEDARAPVSAAVGRGLETRPAWAGGATILVEGLGPEAFEAPFFDVEQLRPWHASTLVSMRLGGRATRRPRRLGENCAQ
jgi:hypothetical protein